MNPSAIARLFAREAREEAALRKTREKLDAACRAYSAERGYRVPLRRESVRAEIGGLNG